MHYYLAYHLFNSYLKQTITINMQSSFPSVYTPRFVCSTECGSSYKFLHFMTYKTAKTSILKSYDFTVNQRIMDFNQETYSLYPGYFTFTFVRNPWDRIVSCYHFFRRKQTDLKFPWTEKFKEYFMNDFSYFIKNITKIDDKHVYPQFLLFPSTIDFIGRFENLQQDYDVVCDKIGMPPKKLQVFNLTSHKHYTEYYNDETVGIVAELYSKDIDYFNYKFGE